MLLTLASTGSDGLAVDVCGPSDLSLLARAMRVFVKSAFIRTTSFGAGLPLRTRESPSGLGAVSIRGGGSAARAVSSGGSPSGVGAVKTRANSPGEAPRAEAQQLGGGSIEEESTFLVHEDELLRISAVVLSPGSTGSPGGGSSVVYVCEMAQSAGKFNPAAAVALGLRPGPKFGLLQQGKSVLLDDGITMVRRVIASFPLHPLHLIPCCSLSLVASAVASQSLRASC